MYDGSQAKATIIDVAVYVKSHVSLQTYEHFSMYHFIRLERVDMDNIPSCEVAWSVQDGRIE